jgi:tetratricopeptide (TPR) repeat protein
MVVLAGALASLALGCGAARSPAWTGPLGPPPATPPATVAQHDALVVQGEHAWAQRSDEAELRRAIELWTQALEVIPNDHALWGRLARAQYFLGDAFLAGDPARASEATATFEQAITSGERGLLARQPELASQLRAGERLTSLLHHFDERDVGALYWRTMALARWAASAGMAAQQASRAEARLSMARVAELDRGYDGAGADRFLGDAWATLSTYQGGDLERAHRHFETALFLAPSHLSTRVLYATHYATKIGDRALFEEQLGRVIAADPSAERDGDATAENAVEQARARAALARIDQLF